MMLIFLTVIIGYKDLILQEVDFWFRVRWLFFAILRAVNLLDVFLVHTNQQISLG